MLAIKNRNQLMTTYRQRLGLNQIQAAKLAEITVEMWTKLETMRFTKVSTKAIDKVATMLGVHYDEIAPPEIRGESLKWNEILFTDLFDGNDSQFE